MFFYWSEAWSEGYYSQGDNTGTQTQLVLEFVELSRLPLYGLTAVA